MYVCECVKGLFVYVVCVRSATGMVKRARSQVRPLPSQTPPRMTETGAPGVSPKRQWTVGVINNSWMQLPMPDLCWEACSTATSLSQPHPKNHIYASLALPWVRLHWPRLRTSEPHPAAQNTALTFLNLPDSLSLIISPQALQFEYS